MNDHAQKISWKCKCFLWITAVVRCILQLGIPIKGSGNAVDDDVLMAEYADSLLRMQWLGDYSVSAMNKVPGFSIFLAMSRFFNISYPLALGLLWCFAVIIFFFAIRKLTKNDVVAGVFYLYVLFSPAMMAFNTIQRVYRSSVVPALVLIVVSCYLAMFVERSSRWRALMPWSICCGIFYGFFYITREDSTWLACFVFGAIVLILGTIVIKEKGLKKIKQYIPIVCSCLLPVLICIGCVHSIKFMNYRHYGLYETTDFSGTSFADATKSMLQIQAEEELPCVWVTHETIEKIYEVSPTFAQIQPQLEEMYKGSVQLFGSGKDDGEIEEGYIIWAIRWAADAAGIYNDPQIMNDFYKEVHEEIEAAFADGRLEKNDKLILSNLARPTEWTDILPCMKTMFICLDGALMRYENVICSMEGSVGSEENLKLMDGVTGESLIGYPTGDYAFKGWAVAMDDEVQLQMYLINSIGETIYPITAPSVDVYQYLQTKGVDNISAQRCRFEFVLSASEAKNAQLYVVCDGTPVYVGIPEGFVNADITGIEKSVDDIGIIGATDSDELYYGRWVKLANIFIGMYRVTGAFIACVALFGYMYTMISNLIRCIKKKEHDFAMGLLQTGLLLTIFANAFMVSFNYWENPDRWFAWYNYTGGIYPVWHVFVCISVFCLAKTICERVYLRDHTSTVA